MTIIQKSDNPDEAKKAAAEKAIEFVRDGMLLGIGTGSTVYFFIEALSKSGLKIQGLATSKQSEKLARERGIKLLDENTVTYLDLIIDGADEVDSQKRMIKGGGGALLREKIAAHMAKERIIIVDDKKVVKNLGAHPLPIEIAPWGRKATEKFLNDIGLTGKFRENLSDNLNYLFDAQLPNLSDSPERWEAKIREIPGVITTGFFFGLASRVCVGYCDKKVQIL